MSRAAGIIFSNNHDRNIFELTKQRTMASVPFMCRYRLVDFALSSMVNSDISNINIITQYNYHSLMEHIGSGKDWDLARHSGGIKILPPYITAYANNTNTLNNSRLEALKSINYTINKLNEDYVVLSDCDGICNINLKELIEYHEKNESDITVACASLDSVDTRSPRNSVLVSDKENYLTDIYTCPNNTAGKYDVSMNIFVIGRRLLQNIILDAISHNYTSFRRDIISKNIGKMKIKVYHYSGFYACIGSFAEYYMHSISLLKERKHMNALFSVRDRPIYTKVHNSPPSNYHSSAEVKGSLIADGCVIKGRVENSILFRGVRIERGAVVKNSIVFRNCIIGEGSDLNCVVSDKNVVIMEGRSLSGHQSLPYYIGKGITI